jgi:hypothetical protein
MTVHGKRAAVLLHTIDASAWLNDVSVSETVETAETTTFGVAQGSKTYVAGLNDATVTVGGLFDGDANAIDDTLAQVLGQDSPVVFIVAESGLAVGNRCACGQAIDTSYEVSSPVADVVSVSAEFQATSEAMRGVLLAAKAAVSSTSDGVNVDHGASTANGGTAVLAVPVNTRNGSVTVKVQHSADNVSWADLVTFAAVTASTVAAERVVVPAGTTVNRHLRATFTVAGSTGSISPVVAFARRF